ncbi:CocE/NonD family hydrolase [Leisingera thetidis]|uniref:CocE/NonD family hydrolase n=1 Tax=Leisingera thetidis TaxID=2930199 RepID=UPI0021F75DAF|nr:CocE/NonD family hydrolase [Leisingera thetidis]
MQDARPKDHWIPMPDGRRLAARLWLPEGTGPFPAILEYLPCCKRDGTAARDETTHRVFAAEGYACVRVDIAGTGDSEGVFDDEYSQQELRDGEAVLAWIAAQPWCTGRVGMIGIGWGGSNGLQLAVRRPEALKAVVAVASTVDRYGDDIHYMGGCLLSGNAAWGARMFACLTRPADPRLRPDWREDWIARMEEVPFLAADWLKHPLRDGYWQHGSVSGDWSAIQVPVLAITGWADPYVNAPPALAANLQGPAKALIGPWEHCYTHLSRLDAADFHSEVLGWFDRWLKQEENGAEDLPACRTYMQEHFNPAARNTPRQGRWVAEAEWPSPNVSEEVWHLVSGGFAAAAGQGMLAVRSPAHAGQAAGSFCPGMHIGHELAGDQAEDDALSVCFDSEALNAPLELLGRARLKLRVSADKPVAQIVARLCDVSPEGVSQRISYRALNLTHLSSHEALEALVPGQICEAEIVLNQCAHRLRAGHRLRLALTTSYWPTVWPAPEAAAVTLYLEGSALYLPVRAVQEEIAPANPGPAQDFPVLAAEQLRTPSSRSKRKVLEDGTVVLETFDDFGEARNPDHGLATGSHATARYAIHPNDQASARFETQWRFTFERDGWQIAIDTESTMYCDRKNFHLTRKLRATESADETEVLAKEWAETLPRGLL